MGIGYLTEIEQIQWEFLRRNPEFIADYAKAKKFKGLPKNNAAVFDPQLFQKWGLEFSVPDPNLAKPKSFHIGKKLFSKMISKDEIADAKVEEGMLIQTWLLNNLRRQAFGNNSDEEKFLLAMINLDKYSNFSELQKEIIPLLKKHYQESKDGKQLRTISNLKYLLKRYDEFTHELKEVCNVEVSSLEPEELKRYLSLPAGKSKMFKRYLQLLWGMGSPTNVEKLLLETFTVIKAAPFIGIDHKKK